MIANTYNTTRWEFPPIAIMSLFNVVCGNFILKSVRLCRRKLHPLDEGRKSLYSLRIDDYTKLKRCS